ncbi:MAG: hypothetical protein JWO36_6258 [Myxococcales bacterium]|nr:hypothetical protein [Myxococcales bacterium]
MSHLFRFRNLALALGIVAGQGCNNAARDADKAADRVIDKQKDLTRKDDRDLAIADKKSSTSGDSAASQELADATAAFDARRRIRVTTLRTQHAVIATQPMLISTMVEAFPLTDRGRADVNEKLTIFQMRLDETGNLIQGLQAASPQDFKDRNDAASDAMNRLDDARKDAWKALEDAPRTDRSS